MANMSAAIGIRLIADEIEASLGRHPDPGPNPEVQTLIESACARLARFDSQARVLGARMAALAASYYGEDSEKRHGGGDDLRFIEMRSRLLTAIRARADAFAINARY